MTGDWFTFRNLPDKSIRAVKLSAIGMIRSVPPQECGSPLPVIQFRLIGDQELYSITRWTDGDDVLRFCEATGFDLESTR